MNLINVGGDGAKYTSFTCTVPRVVLIPEISPILPKMQYRVSASTQVFVPNRYYLMTLHKERLKHARCDAAFVKGWRWKVGMGNASSPTYVLSIY